METSPHSDRLLDLLYGECSPEEEAQLREAIDADDDLADQWRQLQKSHREVQKHIPPPEEVPDDVCAAILEAASEQTDSDSSSPRQGLWTTFVDSGGLRIAASLAAVAFATVVIYIYYGGDVVDEQAMPEQIVAEATIEESEPAALEEDFEEEAAAISDHEAIDGLARSELDALETAEEADSEALELAEALAAQEESRQQESPSADVDSDDGPIALREEPAPSPRPQAAPDDLGIRGRAAGGSASPPAQLEAEEEADSPGLIGGLDDEAAFGDAAEGDIDIALDDDLAAQAPAEAELADEAPPSLLLRARAAYEQGDLDRARSYIDDIDREDLADDELDELHELQEALDDE